MPLIRKQLKPSDVYPENMRYNETTDTIETNINGEWVENPLADPRKQTTLPPRVTSNTKCDAAASVTAAFRNQIDSILTAIDNGGTAFTIAGFILGMLAFGPFGVFIGLALYVADQMLGAGTAALEAAFTEPVWEQFTCILYCNMDNNGRLDAGSMATVMVETDFQIGGLAATILNGMLKLSGEGGVNNLAALGTSTGSCGSCGCDEPCNGIYEPLSPVHGIILERGNDYIIAEATDPGNGIGYIILISEELGECCQFISVEEISGTYTGGFRIDCGTAYDPGLWTSPLNIGCWQNIQLQATVGAVLKINFSQCA